MADLSSAFQSITLNPPPPAPPTLYHTLNITFPAMHLLPEGSVPYLRAPKDHTYREKPKLGAYHLAADNLSFFHRFPVNPDANLQAQSSGPDDLLATVSGLAASTGHSSLEIASVDRGGEEGVWHALCLTISPRTENSENLTTATRYTFYLSEERLERVLGLRNRHDHPWLALVSNLMDRESDRAYLHVMQQLLAVDVDLARQEEHRYEWDTDVIKRGNLLMAAGLGCQLEDGRLVSLSSLDPNQFVAHENEPIPFVLPCSHTAEYTFRTLRKLTDAKCAMAACPTCEDRILESDEIARLLLKLEREVKADFLDTDSGHSDEPLAPSSETIEVPLRYLHHALEAALNSLRVPHCVSPAALNLANLAETRAMLYTLQEMAVVAGGTVYDTPCDLLEAMSSQAVDGLAALIRREQRDVTDLPPGIGEFVERWLTRAVHCVIGHQWVLQSEAVEELGEQLGEVQMS